jgi:tetratricopeptide (TPR) repeat protein
LLAQGQALLDRGEHAQARPVLLQAESLGPDRLTPALLLARSHLEDDGDLAAAEAAVGRAQTASPGAPAAHFLLGRIREGQARWADAHAQYAAVVAAEADHGLAHERLASVSLVMAQQARAAKDEPGAKRWLEDAVQGFLRAREVAGDRPAYALGESQAREALGDHAGAEAALQRWLAQEPEAPGAHLALASFYERRGSPQRAAAARAAAGSPPAKRKLRPLR